MAGLFQSIATEDPNFLTSSEENAQRAEKAASEAKEAHDQAHADMMKSAEYMELAAGAVSGVALFNNRFGNVKPMAGDYTAAMVGARASTWVPTWNEVSNKPAVATLDGNYTVTGLVKFNGPTTNGNLGLTFGPNASATTENPTTGDVEIIHGETRAVLGLQGDGVLFSRTNTGTKLRYYTEANPFPLASTYKLFTGQAEASITITAKDYSVFNITLTAPVTNFNFATYADPEPQARQITVMLKQGLGSQKVNWPASVKWAQGRAPTLSLEFERIDVITFLTVDGGLTYLGFFNGGWF